MKQKIMRVSDLAKELGISSDTILVKLKSLRLKAKDSKQELNAAVIPVLRRELGNLGKAAVKAPVKEKEAPARKAEKETKATAKKPTEKSQTKAVKEK